MTTASAQIPAGSLSILEKFLPKNNVPSAANAAKAAADPGFLELPSMGENESLAEDALQRESKKSPFMVEVPEKFAYIVERFGKFKRRLDAGWHVLLPFVDRVRFVHSLHEQPMPLPQTGCTTKDGVPITAAGVLFVKVVDPVSASYTVENPFRSLLILAQACVKNVVGERRMRDAVAARTQVGEMLQEEINETVGPWGLSVTRFELTDLEPPEETAALLRDEAERGMQREIEMVRAGHVVPSAGRADDGVGVPSAGNAYDDGRELLHAPVGASAARAGSLADAAGYPAPPPAAPSAAAHEAAPPPAATPSPYAPAYYEPPVAPPAAPSAAAAVAGSVDHDAAPDSLASIQILGASWGGAMTRRASEAAHPPVGLPMEADPPTAAAHEQYLAAEHTHLLPLSHEVASIVAHAAAPPQTVLRTPPPPPVPEDPYTPSAPLPETAPTAAAAPPPPAWSGLPQLTLAGGGTLQPVYAAAPGFVPPHALHAFVSNAGGEHPQFVQIAVPVAEGSGGGGNPGLPPAFAPVQATHPAAQG